MPDNATTLSAIESARMEPPFSVADCEVCADGLDFCPLHDEEPDDEIDWEREYEMRQELRDERREREW